MSRPELPTFKAEVLPIATNIGVPTVIKSATLPGELAPSLFIATQRGIIYIANPEEETRLFLDIHERVMVPDGNYDERGLLGMEFHPGFSRNGYFYLYYTERGDGPERPEEGRAMRDVRKEPVSVRPVDPCDPSSKHQVWNDRQRYYDHIDALEVWKISGAVASPVSMILRLIRPFSNHNGVNTLTWYRERLLLSVGDGGNAYDPFGLAQDDDAIFGKVVSINANAMPMGNIEPVTRFSEISPVCRSQMEVLAKGLRNPASLDLEAGRTGYIVDVGQNVNEEVNAFSNLSGLNFGWRPWEGHMPTLTVGDCRPPVPGRHDVHLESSSVVKVSAGDIVRFHARYSGLVETGCSFEPLPGPGINFPARTMFAENVPFDTPGTFCFLSRETGARIRVDVAPLDNKSYTITFAGEALSTTSYLPFVSTSHVIDKRTSALSGGRLVKGPAFDGSFVFASWSELDGGGKPMGRGTLFYARPGEDLQKLQPYGIIETGLSEYFTTLGTNSRRDRLFLGTSTAPGNSGQGKVYEIVRSDRGTVSDGRLPSTGGRGSTTYRVKGWVISVK